MEEYIKIALEIVGTLALVASVTPTPKDDGILFVAKQILNFFAGNFGHAKTAGDQAVELSVEGVEGLGAKAGIKKILSRNKF